MLRKKLSKVILSSLVAAMAVGVSATAGQAVQAQEAQVIAETVTTQTSGVVNITKGSSESDIINSIKNNNVTGINVFDAITLTQGIADALNAKGTFTINVQNGGRVDITSDVSLNNSKLTIVRVKENTGLAINVTLNPKSREIANVTINGVKFVNESNTAEPMVGVQNLVSGKTVSIDNVTIDGGVLLNAQNTSIKVPNATLLNGGQVYSGQKTVVTLDAITKPNLNTLEIKGTAPAGSKVTIVITDSKGTKIDPITVPADDQGNFSTTYTGEFNNTYTVVASTTSTHSGTSLIIQSKTQTIDTVSPVKVDVKDTTSNSATIGLTYADGTVYPLTLTVKDKSGNVVNKPYEIKDNTVKEVSVTGLSSNTTYTYSLTDKSNQPLATGSFTTRTSSTITGGEGSVVTTDISSSDVSKATIKDTSIVIPVSNKSLVSSMEKGKDFKVDVKGVSVEFNNGELTLTGLVPEKEYRNIVLTYVDNNNRTRTVRIPRFTTKTSETKVRQFVKDVYTYSLDRVADEEGFAYWEKQLTNKTTTPESFVKNLLSEKEFINKYTTTEGKIEGLYQVIVNRKSDSEGLKFWVNRYNDLVKQGFTQEIALSVVVDEMVNEQEFKNRVKDLGL